jgi:transcriptional regulator with XRE-family HTH domain
MKAAKFDKDARKAGKRATVIDNVSNELGAAVKSARQLSGMTQKELAGRLEITERYLKAVENSGRKPSYKLLTRIARELGISIEIVLHSEKETATVKARGIER